MAATDSIDNLYQKDWGEALVRITAPKIINYNLQEVKEMEKNLGNRKWQIAYCLMVNVDMTSAFMVHWMDGRDKVHSLWACWHFYLHNTGLANPNDVVVTFVTTQQSVTFRWADDFRELVVYLFSIYLSPRKTLYMTDKLLKCSCWLFIFLTRPSLTLIPFVRNFLRMRGRRILGAIFVSSTLLQQKSHYRVTIGG